MAKTRPAKRTKRVEKPKPRARKAPAKPPKRKKAGPARTRRSSWQMQEARANLSAVIEAAMAGRPQSITRAGKEAVFVLSAKDYKMLLKATQSVDELFLNSPLSAVFGKDGVPEYRDKEALGILAL